MFTESTRGNNRNDQLGKWRRNVRLLACYDVVERGAER